MKVTSILVAAVLSFMHNKCAAHMFIQNARKTYILLGSSVSCLRDYETAYTQYNRGSWLLPSLSSQKGGNCRLARFSLKQK